MNKKFLLLLVVLVLCIVMMGGFVNAYDDFITCKEGTVAKNNPAVFDECTVEISQIVDINQIFSGTPDVTSWKFNKLTINEDVTLHFINTLAPRADSGDYGKHGSPSGNGEGGDGGTNVYSGADGGNSGMHGNTGGGGGGGGGAGGEQFMSGGNGNQGGDAFGGTPQQPRGNHGNGGSAGYAGANVALVVYDTLSFYENSQISVNGTLPLSSATIGWASNFGGGGGGGGAGGSGAGQIAIYVSDIYNGDSSSDYGLVTATGGNAGGGAWGQCDDDGNDEGGGAGGGGGGADGGDIYLYYFQETAPDFDNFFTAKGLAGSGNSACDDGSSSGAGAEASDEGQIHDAETSIENTLECNDGLDNDLDLFIDFEDSDCWGLAVEEDLGVDQNGPLPQGTVTPLGLTNHSEYPWWNPDHLFFGGIDGVCGDDDFVPCVVNCLALPDDEDTCNQYAGCSWSEVHLLCVQGSFLQITDEECAGFKTMAECEAPINNPKCVWQGDHVKYNTDYAYVSDDDRYFCNQDVRYETDGITFRNLVPGGWPLATGWYPAWKWWDAKALGTPFIYHTFQGTDFVSNGAEWYYCNASPTTPEYGAKAIDEGGSFEAMTFDGNIMCTTTINSVPWFYNEFSKYFTNCNSDIDQYCCSNETVGSESFLASYDPAEGFIESIENGVCGTNCRLAGPEKLKDYLATHPPEQTELEEEYCDLFPQDVFCSITVDPLPGFGDFEVGVVDFSNCGPYMEGCLTGAVDLSMDCEAILDYTPEVAPGETVIQYRGRLCDKYTQYCKSPGEYIFTNDTRANNVNNDSVCCLGPKDDFLLLCEDVPDPLDQNTCESIGGDYIPPEQRSDYVCVPSNYVINDSCCLGGRWLPAWEELAFNQISQPEAHICYNHNNESWLGECCTDFSVCNNKEITTLFGSTYQYDGGIYGKGGVTHSINNFDLYSTDPSSSKSNIVNKIWVKQLEKDQESFYVPFGNNLATDDVYRNNFDWASFDYLEFDIVMNQEKNVILNLSTGTNSVLYTVNDYLTNGRKALRWHKAAIPLNKSGFDYSSVSVITFSTDYEFENFFIAVDNFFLSEKPSSRQNTENYYCTGNFGSWVSNLDGPSNNAFILGDDLDVYGKYWYACEAQPSYDWTGLHCCGDDTKVAYDVAGAQGEYFADLRSGCYHGVPVYPGDTVAKALNDNNYRNLIFYNQQFVACNTIRQSSQRKENYEGTGSQPLSTDLVTVTAPEFTVINDLICMGDEWISYQGFPKARFIVSKMYNLSFDETSPANFEMFCESKNIVSPNFDFSFQLGQISSNISDFCVLTDDSDEDFRKSLIGLSFEGTDINTFLGNISGHLEAMQLISEDQRADFASLCDTYTDEFFRECGKVESIHVKYNKDFNIVFIADIDNPLTDFNGFFEENAGMGDYIRFYWDSFIGLFANWFGGGTKAGADVNWTSETLLPLHEGDWVEYGVNLAKFNRLLLKFENNKRILGIVEERESPTGETDEYVVVMFDHFNTSVEKIGKNYFSDHKYSLDYVVGNDRQVLHYQTPLSKGINLEGETKNFEPPFDWRRIGAALRFDATDYGSPYVQTSNNCIIELGEYCDTCPGEDDVFKYEENSCEFWNPDYGSGEVECVMPGNTLSYDGCGEAPECEDDSDCDDGYICENELCIPDWPDSCEDLEQNFMCNQNPSSNTFLATDVSLEECQNLCNQGDYSCCEYRGSIYKNCYGAYNSPTPQINDTFYASFCGYRRPETQCGSFESDKRCTYEGFSILKEDISETDCLDECELAGFFCCEYNVYNGGVCYGKRLPLKGTLLSGYKATICE